MDPSASKPASAIRASHMPPNAPFTSSEYSSRYGMSAPVEMDKTRAPARLGRRRLRDPRESRPVGRSVFRLWGIVPWQDLCAAIMSSYPRGANGRPPAGPERMLRIYRPGSFSPASIRSRAALREEDPLLTPRIGAAVGPRAVSYRRGSRVAPCAAKAGRSVARKSLIGIQ